MTNIKPIAEGKYRFTGQDGSLGFETCRTYHLRVYPYPKGGGLTIRSDEGLKCDYSSIDTFLNNWVKTEN